MKNRSLAVNASLAVIDQFVAVLAPLITFPYVSRILQANHLGAYNFSSSIIEYFMMIAFAGMSAYSIRTGSALREDKIRLKAFADQVFTIDTLRSVVSYLLFFPVLAISARLSPYKALLLIQSTAIVCTLFSVQWVYFIFEDFLYITVRNTVVRAVSILLIFLFVKTEADLIKYALILMSANVVTAGINYFHSKKFIKVKLTRHPGIRRHFKSIGIFFANSIASTIYLSSDYTMLGLMCNDSAVGNYTVASKIYFIAKSVINSASGSAIPRISYLAETNRAEMNLMVGKMLRSVIFICLPAATGMCLIHKDIVHLVAGSGYDEAKLPLLILSVSLALAVISKVLLDVVLISLKKEKLVLYTSVASAIVNLGLNFYLIPKWGPAGAAATTLAAEFVVFVMGINYCRKDMAGVEFKKTLLHTLIGVAVMAAAFSMLQPCLSTSALVLRILVEVMVCASIYFLVERILKEEAFFYFSSRISRHTRLSKD